MPTTLDEDSPPSKEAAPAAADDDNNCTAAATAASKNNQEGDDDIIDVINTSLTTLLNSANTSVETAQSTLETKRLELEKAEEELEDAQTKLVELRDLGQSLADDDVWQSMYHRLRVWSKSSGSCNPRRNWKAKIDAEEKALGNWAGKQRREERQNELNPFKKLALERIGFTFDSRSETSWDTLHEKLKSYTAEHGKLPENLNDKDFEEKIGKESKLKLLRYRQIAKRIIGDIKVKDEKTGTSIKREMMNNQFTQNRIDILSKAGMTWMLSTDQVNRLKEKGLFFPIPKHEPNPDEGDVVALEKHAWLTMYEALVEFKKEYGHTFVTPSNSSEELYHWVTQQRKKMKAFHAKKGKAMKDKMFADYQAEMLKGIDFAYSKPDIDWMESYERMVAYKRLFGTVAVTDKFASFEVLQQWVDDNKRLHLGTPQLSLAASVSWARGNGIPTIPLEERKQLLDKIGLFDFGLGTEDAEIRKSNYFFRSAEQVLSWDDGVLSSLREKRKAAVSALMGDSEQGKKDGELGESSPAKLSVHERCVAKAAMPSTTWHFDAAKEKEFFMKRGVIVAAGVEERERMRTGGFKMTYNDGRPSDLCRISNCFNNQSAKKQFLCTRHFNMIEAAATCKPQLPETQAAVPNEAAGGTAITGMADSTVAAGLTGSEPAAFTCHYCEQTFDTYADAAGHEKSCGKVDEATRISVPLSQMTRPTWTRLPMPIEVTGEAKVLAESYRYMVWEVTQQYREKSKDLAGQKGNEHIAAALGKASMPQKSDVKFYRPKIKYPSDLDQKESVKLFRLCGGPLAATVSGHKKLLKENRLYGDGRELKYCRVSGCQMCPDETVANKRHLCNWHHSMIYQGQKFGVYGSVQQSISSKRKRVDNSKSKAPAAKRANVPVLVSIPTDPAVRVSNALKSDTGFKSNSNSVSAAQARAAEALKVAVAASTKSHERVRQAAYDSLSETTKQPSTLGIPLAQPLAQKLPPANAIATKPAAVPASASQHLKSDTDSKLLAKEMKESLKTQAKPDSADTMAVDTPLDPAEHDVSQFMGC